MVNSTHTDVEATSIFSPSAGASPPLLSYFWTPLVAVGASNGRRMNAQISVSTFGAGIVPERPRLLCVLYKHNFTHDLVSRSGTLSVNLLAETQVDLLEKLGLVSGRRRDKLRGLHVVRSERGNPVFPDALGYLEGDVITSYDLGDATAFLVAVVAQHRFRDGEPIRWEQIRPALSAAWHTRWAEKLAVDVERSRALMRWISQ